MHKLVHSQDSTVKKHYELQKWNLDGHWLKMCRFDTVEEANANLTEMLSSGSENAYRVVLYDGPMKVGWKTFRRSSLK